MPVTRYFLWVGSVLLALLFVADACLPKLPARKATATPAPVIRVYSERQWPERIVFDTSAPLPRVAATNPVDLEPAQPTALVSPSRAREAMAQAKAPDPIRAQATKPNKPDAQRQRKIARRSPPPPWIAHRSQVAWFGSRSMWW